MITDNFPVEFYYISKRLTTDIVQQWVAGQSQTKVKEWHVSLGAVRTTIKPDEIDWNNQYQLAKLATIAVQDHAGWIDASDRRRRIPTGRYVRARMFLQRSLLSVNGWKSGGSHPVAAFAGWEELPEFGRVFVGLVGSEANLIEVQEAPRLTSSGRTASDVRGLYELIKATQENPESVPSDFQLRQDAELTGPKQLLASAADSFRASDLLGSSELLDVLFAVHQEACVEDVDLQLEGPDDQPLGQFKLAMLGAPIWVSTPLPEVGNGLLPTGRRAYQQMSRKLDTNASPIIGRIPVARSPEYSTRHALDMFGRDYPASTGQDSITITAPALRGTRNWDVFESWADLYTQVWQGRVSETEFLGWDGLEDEWDSFCHWAVDMAVRFANDPWPFVRRVTKKRKLVLKTVEWESQGEAGWVTLPKRFRSGGEPRHSEQQFMLLTTGGVYPCAGHGLEIDSPGSQNSFETQEAAEAILRTIARWKTPFSPKDWSDPDIDANGQVTKPRAGIRS